MSLEWHDEPIFTQAMIEAATSGWPTTRVGAFRKGFRDRREHDRLRPPLLIMDDPPFTAIDRWYMRGYAFGHHF